MEKDSEFINMVNSRSLIKDGEDREVPLSQRGLQTFLACSTSKALWLIRLLNSVLGHPRQVSEFNPSRVLLTPLRAVEVEAVRHGNQLVWAFVHEKDADAMRALFVRLLDKHKNDRPWLNKNKEGQENEESFRNYVKSL